MGADWRLYHAARAYIDGCYTTVTRLDMDLQMLVAISIVLNSRAWTVYGNLQFLLC